MEPKERFDAAASSPVDSLQRRRLLRGGALLAGAAGVAIAGAAVPARAANGDPVLAGGETTATRSTRLTLDAVAGRSQPTLSLDNPSGAALELSALPESWAGELGLGQIANLPTGPIVGIDHGGGVANAYLALSIDLDALSLPVAIPPQRILDTRTKDGRANILRASSGSALDSTGRLREGQWLDLALASTNEATIDGIFANLTVTGSLTSGYLTVYPGGDRPATSSINFAAGKSLANGGFFATGLVDEHYVVRIYTSATSHIILDISGFTGPATPPGAGRAMLNRQSTRRRSVARRTLKAIGRSSSR